MPNNSYRDEKAHLTIKNDMVFNQTRRIYLSIDSVIALYLKAEEDQNQELIDFLDEAMDA